MQVARLLGLANPRGCSHCQEGPSALQACAYGEVLSQCSEGLGRLACPFRTSAWSAGSCRGQHHTEVRNLIRDRGDLGLNLLFKLLIV